MLELLAPAPGKRVAGDSGLIPVPAGLNIALNIAGFCVKIHEGITQEVKNRILAPAMTSRAATLWSGFNSPDLRHVEGQVDLNFIDFCVKIHVRGP